MKERRALKVVLNEKVFRDGKERAKIQFGSHESECAGKGITTIIRNVNRGTDFSVLYISNKNNPKQDEYRLYEYLVLSPAFEQNRKLDAFSKYQEADEQLPKHHQQLPAR